MKLKYEKIEIEIIEFNNLTIETAGASVGTILPGDSVLDVDNL